MKNAGNPKFDRDILTKSPTGIMGLDEITNKNDELEMEQKWELKLYIAGKTLKSETALYNLKKYCREHLEGRYSIEVIDLLKKPQLAEGDQIFAVPTLVRKVPVPIRKIIGDLSNEEKVLVGLNIVPVKK